MDEEEEDQGADGAAELALAESDGRAIEEEGDEGAGSCRALSSPTTCRFIPTHSGRPRHWSRIRGPSRLAIRFLPISDS